MGEEIERNKKKKDNLMTKARIRKERMIRDRGLEAEHNRETQRNTKTEFPKG